MAGVTSCVREHNPKKSRPSSDQLAAKARLEIVHTGDPTLEESIEKGPILVQKTISSRYSRDYQSLLFQP